MDATRRTDSHNSKLPARIDTIGSPIALQTTMTFVKRSCSKCPGRSVDLRCLSRAIRHRTSTSHSGTARRSPADRIVPRDQERQPTAPQRVRNGQSWCWSSSLRKHVGEDGHNRAKRAGTRRQRPPPQKVSSGQMCYTVRAGDYHRYHMYPIS